MQVAGGDGPHDRQLVSGVLDREDVQRPVAHGRAAKVWMVEADPVVGKERHWGHAGCQLLGPLEIPRCAQTAIGVTLQARRDDPAGTQQQMSIDLLECLAGNGLQ